MQNETRTINLSIFSERLTITLLLFLALGQGLIHFFLLPPWQHYDEPTHFEYAWLIANRGELPDLEAVDHTMRREVMASMEQHNFFWNLSLSEFLTDDNEIWIGVSELVHPPLYYLITSIPLYLTRHLDITTQLYVARLVSLLMFLLIIGIAIGFMRDLVPRNHPLRWLVPLTILLWPPFASHMTAVNNDVGAVLIFSLFLWGAVRLIRYDLSWSRLLWVIGAACITIITKNTASIALLLLPIALIIALWVEYKWPWRRFAVGAIGLGFLFLVLVVDVGDAAYWYRDEFHNPQVATTRANSLLSPNQHALALEINLTDPDRKLLNPLLPSQVEKIKGNTVTIGGWLWADNPVKITSPGLSISLKGQSTLTNLQNVVDVTTTPTFFAHTYELPDETEVAYYAFWAESLSEQSESFRVYLDHAFLVIGDHSNVTENISLTVPLPPAIQENNLIRNPSGEQMWFRLRPSTHSLTAQFLRRSPAYIFSALEDLQKSIPLLFGQVAPFLFHDFFAAFAWGHVRLDVGWMPLFYLLITIIFVGVIKSLLEHQPQKKIKSQYPLLCFLGLTALVVWGVTLLWPLPYQEARIQLPSGRYLYTSIIPTILILTSGWYALWPKAYRQTGILTWIGLLLLLNVVSIITIFTFYSSLPLT